MTVSSANRATRELHMALAMAGLRGDVTDFWSKTWDHDDVRTIVVITDPTDEALLLRVQQVCLAAFPDIIAHYVIRPEHNVNPNDRRGRKLAFGFHRPRPGWEPGASPTEGP
jgi:flagellar biosynthesis/type III secretory pathway ATPase